MLIHGFHVFHQLHKDCLGDWKVHHAQTPAHEHDQKKNIPVKKLIPEEYHEWLDIFNEKASEQFPDSRPWDHAINLKDGFKPKSFKAYPLSPEEHKLQEEFIKENLEKKYIWLSKSPMASPFFFITKKEKGKTRPTQDYRYLNNWTIKNAERCDMSLIEETQTQNIYTSGARLYDWVMWSTQN